MSLFVTGVVLGFVCAVGVSIIDNDGKLHVRSVCAALVVGVGLGLVLADDNPASRSQAFLGAFIGIAGAVWGTLPRKNTV